ncbi:MAG: universal stress protein, partial [Pirellulales bacterium]
SFVFKTSSMVILRFKDRNPREFRVPLNVRVGNIDVPVGLSLVFFIVLLSAVSNLFTKPVATVGGLMFTAVFLSVFLVSETVYHRRRKGEKHEHLEQFNRAMVPKVTAESLGLSRPYRKLVAIRSPNNLFMLDKALADTDPETTDVVVMTAKVEPRGAEKELIDTLDAYDQQLLTAVVNHAERLGKTVRPLLVPTNNALHAVLNTAKDLPAQEVILGASNKYTVEEQLDQVALYWISLHGGRPPGLTVHIDSADRNVAYDLDGGNRIPKAAERQARSVADLRAAGIGVRRVLLAHDGTRASRDVFEWVFTMLAADVALDIVPVPPAEPISANGENPIELDRQWAEQLSRTVNVLAAERQSGQEIVRLIGEGSYDAIVLPASSVPLTASAEADDWAMYVVQHAPCGVFIAAHPAIPREVVAQ